MKKAISQVPRGAGASKAKKMTQDLEQAMELVSAWSNDPAEVFKEYGLVKDTTEVQVDISKVDFGVPRFGRFGGMGPDVVAAKVCGCGCAAVVEAELEVEW